MDPGTRLGPYEILEPLGAGGMGEVYRARHLELGREVAIKVLPRELADDPDRLHRFKLEARSASALNHPNVITIHDIGTVGETAWMSMELVDGRTLRDVIAEGPMPIDDATEIAAQICEGLAKAHAAGIIHRDLKPENVMITADGLVKILDFGIAKLVAGAATASTEEPTLVQATAAGAVLGTAAYMSPEQARGTTVSNRSDQFSFGVVLYEMLCGRRPFAGATAATLLAAIMRDDALPLSAVRPGIPQPLAAIVERCLQKDPEARYADIEEPGTQLRRLATGSVTGSRRKVRTLSAALAALVIVVLIGSTWIWLRGSRERWAREQALPEIAQLATAGDLYEGYRLALEAQRYIPGNIELQELINRITLPVRVATEPEGAEVWIKGYDTPDAPWEHLGRTPIENLRIPYASMRWRFEKEGYEPIVAAPFGSEPFRALGQGLKLHEMGTVPEGMVEVPAGFFSGALALDVPNDLPAVSVGAFWLDRYEVTNAQYQEFVDAGAYDDPALWPPFDDSGGPGSWSAAQELYLDGTGRPGPSTWELGAYPSGQGNNPVSGVSWHEAQAYCGFVGKTLPTVYHWSRAAAQEQLSDILRHSNFDSDGSAPVGEYPGLGAYGTYDMAGNVREWNSTGAVDTGMRYAPGGAAGDPAYIFGHFGPLEATDRDESLGIRCARYIDTPGEELLLPTAPMGESHRTTVPTSEEFDAWRSFYDYEPGPLEAIVVDSDESSPHWRKETVSYLTGYDGERMQALLFLPRNVEPPYQAVVWFPGNDAYAWPSSETLASEWVFDFIPRTGRALVYPIYESMYERRAPIATAPMETRDRVVHWSMDVGRTLDYLETRVDIDADRIGYYGFSLGAVLGPIITAVDPRFAAAVYLSGGMFRTSTQRPEANEWNFAHFSMVPTLMINGRDDFLIAYAEAQLPLFEAIAAPEKRHAVFETGHIPNRRDIVRETLDWLDLHLGPVPGR